MQDDKGDEQPLIYKANISDAEELSRIGIVTFTETFGDCNTESDMKSYLDYAFDIKRTEDEIGTIGSTFYIARIGGEIAAYMKTNIGKAQTEHDREGWLEVQRLYVLAKYKRRHIGSALMEKAIKDAEIAGAKGVWLGVWEYNYKAQEFYKRFGFTFCGSHDFVLGSDRQTDLLMERAFTRKIEQT